MGRRSYSGGANTLTLAAAIAAGDMTFSTNGPVNWPDGVSGPFAVVMGKGLANEEKMLVSSRTGSVFTVTLRGYDGTAAGSHSGEAVQLCITAIDADEANTHVNAVSGVHGGTGGDPLLTGASVATVTNKTISGANNTLTNIPRTASPQIDAKLTALDATDAVHTAGLANTYTKTVSDSNLAAAVLVETNRATAAEALVYTKTASDAKYLLLDGGTGDNLTLNPKIAANTALTVQGLASQVGDLQAWKDSAAVVAARFNNVGRLFLNRSLTLIAGATTDVAEIVQRIASQSADLTQWQDEAAAVLAFVDINGNAKFPNLPFRTAAGRSGISGSSQAYGASATLAITFPVGRFTQAPIVVSQFATAPAGTALITVRVVSVTTAGCTLTIFNTDPAAQTYSSIEIDWIAVQMTSSAAAG